MPSLILSMSISLDGFLAPADGSGAWIAAGGSDDALAWKVGTVSGAGAHLMGATTYTIMGAHWPNDSGPFAEPMNTIPKVVFSNTLTATEWGEATIARGELTDEIARLKQEPLDGYLLAHGGTRFAQSLAATGLVDEYRLAVHPIYLGTGEPLFRTPHDLRPVSTTVFDGGTVAHAFTASAA